MTASSHWYSRRASWEGKGLQRLSEQNGATQSSECTWWEWIRVHTVGTGARNASFCPVDVDAAGVHGVETARRSVGRVSGRGWDGRHIMMAER